MNQDQVKALLIKIKEPTEEFDVLFTGKSSKQVDGFYKPDERKIYIHNRNMETDSQLIYCAIHEYAHHIHVTTTSMPVSNRCHTNEFRSIFHELLNRAEQMKLFYNVYRSDNDFIELTKKIKKGFIGTNGALMKDFGAVLLKAYNLCQDKKASFDDYVTRELGLGMTLAKQIITVSKHDIDSAIGFENMKIVAQVKEPERRKEAEKAFKDGVSPDVVKQEFVVKDKKKELSVHEQLEKEKKRIERTIENLKVKLQQVEQQLESTDDSSLEREEEAVEEMA
ncbi:MAG: hypothetical protein JXR63_11640 [Spirochaetales bacterium]|nr:hypothetical protein [Spirochaetales bacterium]